jgi:hypothetical protein
MTDVEVNHDAVLQIVKPRFTLPVGFEEPKLVPRRVMLDEPDVGELYGSENVTTAASYEKTDVSVPNAPPMTAVTVYPSSLPAGTAQIIVVVVIQETL